MNRRILKLLESGLYHAADYCRTIHHSRYKRFVAQKKLVCQECRGNGGEKEIILDDGSGPFYECGFCEGTGYTTPHIRGLWLKWKRQGII